MSRRGSRGSSKLLLDTSFLLPILGFETSERVMKAFQELGSYDLHYNDVSVLEVLWKIVETIAGMGNHEVRVNQR